MTPKDTMYAIMNQIEEYINQSFSLFGGYSFVRKTELYEKFKLLYESIPQEMISKKDYLNRQKERNIFSLLNEINFIFEQSKNFLGFIMINVNLVSDYFDKIYDALLEDIEICREKE